MSNEQIYEMISAYAAGCMDDENFLHFRDYIESGGELPESELGELQNVVALMPVILESEEPDPKLKGKLAKNLISIQEEIKEKIKAEKSKNEKPKLKSVEQKKKTEEKTNKNKTQISKTEIKESEKSTQTDNQKERINNPSQNKRLVEELEKQSESIESVSKNESPQKPSKLNLIIISVVALLTLFALFQIFTLKSSINETSETITKDISSIKNRTANLEFFVREHSALIDFFSQGNLNLVNLKGTSNAPDASAKLLFSLERSEGLLYLYNLPAIQEGEVFKLWMVSRGRSYPIKSFEISKTEEYIKIKNLPYIMADEIEVFRITIETDLSSDVPEGKTLVFGSYKR